MSYDISVMSTHDIGFAELNEAVRFFPTVIFESTALIGAEINWELWENNTTCLDSGKISFTNSAQYIECTSDKPAVIRCKVFFITPQGETLTKELGVAFAALEIKPSLGLPADFDEFWQKQLSKLEGVAINPELIELDSHADFTFFNITCGCVGETPVSGMLAKPKCGGKMPAILKVQGAGVRSTSANGIGKWASLGYLAMEINAHGLENNKDSGFYTALSSGSLEDYRRRGFISGEPEKVYFLNMFMRVKRALDYLKTLPEWDGKNLVIDGTSQGGLQALAGAYLEKKVSAITALVSAGSDMYSGGWPFCSDAPARFSDEDAAACRKTIPYFDGTSLAQKNTVPAIFVVGLVDMACKPDGVLAVHNSYNGPKELLCCPSMAHPVDFHAQAKSIAFLLDKTVKA